MKMLLLKGMMILSFLYVCTISYGQIIHQLTDAQIAARVSHVYGESYVANNPTLVTAFGDVMTQRIEYRSVAPDPAEKYPKLSSLPVYNKVNPEIVGADFNNFDVYQFNPLMYNLEFFSNRTQMIRIDNTEYIMIIHGVQRQ